ncbi:DUF1657 domain-containing protein [Halobacillus karajensis]
MLQYLENFALQTNDHEAKKLYGKQAESLKNLINDLDHYLKE